MKSKVRMLHRITQLFTFLFILLFYASFTIADPAPYRDLSNAGAGFYGYGRELTEPNHIKTVRIGLIGPEKIPEGKQLRRGIALAVEQANARGGYRGIPYSVVFRPDDGPWGTTSKQVVHLIYEDKVWAILGALDGSHAHLAELISAKAWIPIVTPYASDLTIDYANVPWIFRCMPDDSRQCRSLLDYARRHKYKNIVALTEAKREAYTGFLRLEENARRERYALAMHLEYTPYNPTAILPRLKGISMDALLIWGSPSSVLPLLRALRRSGVTVPVLCPAIIATPDIAEKAPPTGELIVAAPYDLSHNDAAILDFNQLYQERTGTPPTPLALLSYDAARMVIAAIEHAGLNRVKIRDELSRMSFKGLTMNFHFNGLGGNSVEPVLMALQERRWVRIEQNQR